MKTVVVLSGKGGAGKTSIAASLVPWLTRPVLVDADVDASNLPLLLHAELVESGPFVGGQVARIDAASCTRCGACVDACRFHALDDAEDGGAPVVDPLSCEGCRACLAACPARAISFEDAVSGEWSISSSAFGPLAHARLGPGGENSGALVAHVRKLAKKLGERENRALMLVDGPPGTGCPVISSLTGADLAVLVTEPTPSGQSDLERVLALTRHFDVPSVVVVNKADLDTARTETLAHELGARGVHVVARLPYDAAATRAITERQLLSSASPEWNARFERLWEEIESRLALAALP